MKYTIDVQPINNSRLPEVDFDNLPFGREFADHMFITEYEEGEWRNPRVIPYGPLPLSPSVSALHYGQAIFEGMKAQRAEDGTPLLFRPEKNARRFNKSAHRMSMPDVPEELFISGLEHLLALDADWIPTSPDTSLYIRPFMFACDEYVGIKTADNYKFIIFTCPVGSYYKGAVKVYLSKKNTRAFPGGTGFAKAAGNYGATLQPVIEIQSTGYDQILWLDGIEQKYLQEIGTMNVFIQIGDTLLTPPVQDTILDGVTRDSVIQLARDMGVKVEERQISVDELIKASTEDQLNDAFGAGTAATIAHISDIGYEDINLKLPPVEGRSLSITIKQTLQDIKRGRHEDKFDWVHRVPALVSQ